MIKKRLKPAFAAKPLVFGLITAPVGGFSGSVGSVGGCGLPRCALGGRARCHNPQWMTTSLRWTVEKIYAYARIRPDPLRSWRQVTRPTTTHLWKLKQGATGSEESLPCCMNDECHAVKWTASSNLPAEEQTKTLPDSTAIFPFHKIYLIYMKQLSRKWAVPKVAVQTLLPFLSGYFCVIQACTKILWGKIFPPFNNLSLT